MRRLPAEWFRADAATVTSKLWFRHTALLHHFSISSALLWPRAARQLCADSECNVVLSSNFRGSWFSHIMTENTEPPWAVPLKCFTGARTLGYICVCETFEHIQTNCRPGVRSHSRQKQHQKCEGWGQSKKKKRKSLLILDGLSNNSQSVIFVMNKD